MLSSYAARFLAVVVLAGGGTYFEMSRRKIQNHGRKTTRKMSEYGQISGKRVFSEFQYFCFCRFSDDNSRPKHLKRIGILSVYDVVIVTDRSRYTYFCFFFISLVLPTNAVFIFLHSICVQIYAGHRGGEQPEFCFELTRRTPCTISATKFVLRR